MQIFDNSYFKKSRLFVLILIVMTAILPIKPSYAEKIKEEAGTLVKPKHVRSSECLPSHNQLPVADAGQDMELMEEQAILLDGSNSFDPDGSVVSHDWEIKDTFYGQPSVTDSLAASGPNVPYTFHFPGIQTAKLTVTDNCGAKSSATVTFSVSAMPRLSPALKVQALEKMYPNGNAVWETLDDSKPIEYGLKPRLHGGFSTGASSYEWFLNGSGTPTSTAPFFKSTLAIKSPQTWQLKVSNGSALGETIKTFTPAAQMKLQSVPLGPNGFSPTWYEKENGNEGDETRIWAISQYSRLGLFQFQDSGNPNFPMKLTSLEIVPEVMSQALGVTVADTGNNNKYIAVAAGENGVHIFKSAPHAEDVQKVANISVQELSASYVRFVAAFGSVLYMTTEDLTRIVMYDLSPLDAGGAPAYLDTIVQDGLYQYKMLKTGKSLCVLAYATDPYAPVIARMLIYDVRKPYQPVLAADLEPMDAAAGYYDEPWVANGKVMVRRGTDKKWEVYSIVEPDDLSKPIEVKYEFLAPLLGTAGKAPIGFIGNKRMFQPVNDTLIKKFDISNPNDIYEMNSINLAQPLTENTLDGPQEIGFVVDPDGAEGASPNLLVVAAQDYGFAAYTT